MITRKGDDLASCSIEYSPDVAKRAARQFCWRRWRTPFGILVASALLIDVLTLVGWIYWVGPDFFAGMFASLLLAVAFMQGISYAAIPRILATHAANMKSTPLETTDEGVRLSPGKNTYFTPWSRYSAIWIYDEFILLRRGKNPLGNHFIHVPTRGMTPEVRSAFERAQAAKGLS